MPKQRITKEMVVEAAFELARAGGMEQVLVKNIARKLGCSVQPIYSYCANMEGLKKELQQRTGAFFRKYVEEHIDKNAYFQSTGKAYLQLAKEEPYLYELYFFRKKETPDIHTLQELYEKECNPMMAEHLSKELSISIGAAKQLHFHMVVYNTGIASMLIASNFGIGTEALEKQLELAYEAFLNQALKGEKL